VPGYNVKLITYDPYQLHAMMQRLTKDKVAWCQEFSQGQQRLIADRSLYDAIVNRSIWHDGIQKLTDHVLNAGRQIAKNEDSKMRIVKLEPLRKIDGCVALSMASERCLWLNI
jgi:phage terminase large subunit-like protein